MRRKSKKSAKQARARQAKAPRALLRLSTTRQDAHPLVGAVAPPPPANARWQVMEWCVTTGGWKHFGYAANDREKTRLGDSIRRMGGKTKYRALEFIQPPSRPIEERSTTGGRRIDPVVTPPPPPPPPISDAEYRARLLSSLSLWIKEVRDADALPDLPVKTIRAARDACKYIVERRIGEGGYRGRGDPFAGLE